MLCKNVLQLWNNKISQIQRNDFIPKLRVLTLTIFEKRWVADHQLRKLQLLSGELSADVFLMSLLVSVSETITSSEGLF